MSAPLPYFLLGSTPTFPNHPWRFSPTDTAIAEDMYLTREEPSQFSVPLMDGTHPVQGVQLENLKRVIQVAAASPNPSIVVFISRVLAYQHQLWKECPDSPCCDEIVAIAGGQNIWETAAVDYTSVDTSKIPGASMEDSERAELLLRWQVSMLKTAKLADAYQVPTGGAWDTGRMMAIVKSLTPHTTKAYNWTAERARNAKRDGGRFAPSVAQVAVATVDGATLRAASQATEKKTTRQTKKGPQPSPIPSAGLSVSTPASQTMDIDGFGSTDPTVEDTPMTEVTPTPATQESPPDGASTTLSELLLILQGYLQNPPRMGERPLSTVPTWLVSLTLASEAVKAAPEYKPVKRTLTQLGVAKHISAEDKGIIAQIKALIAL